MRQDLVQPGDDQKLLETTSDLGELELVRNFIRDSIADQSDIETDRERIWNLEVAATEVVSNVIRHAYHGQQGRPISCTASLNQNEIQFCVFHHGDSFRPPAEIEDIEEPCDGGMGLFIVSNLVDQVDYTTTPDGRQCIRLQQQLREV